MTGLDVERLREVAGAEAAVARVRGLADGLSCPPHYRRDPEQATWHDENCHGCEKAALIRAALDSEADQ